MTSPDRRPLDRRPLDREPSPRRPADRRAPARPAAAPRALSFDRAAAEYAAARPGYPPALLDAVQELSGRPLHGARAIDVGAGTGIATRLLDARGARVLAVEPGPGMAAELRRGLPHVPVVRGDGNRLPLASASADLITYAQSWHWTDPERSLPEAYRVLRPGGALALWWNVFDHSLDWIAEQGARLHNRLGTSAHGAHGAPVRAGAQLGALPGPWADAFVHRLLPWSRRIGIDDHLANLATHSVFLAGESAGGAGEERARAILAEERAWLLAAFPDGTVEERYVVELSVAVR
ncbi:Malonyl-[acyl-carrier protein] O-methyltransferase [Streptomyces sp. ADI96-02]|uniref:class I SAM-dependent methyltransferase n=1 Tax=unclassified Streptomyces TaxID=2593676 RepID=UPI000F54F9DD|nr:class I SAM-dependent methyltransferase [Streptomyces sp. ADI96-02]RPK63038.1 Malonyl-[acyl-carrier protein] O-methyltransferase [Streptomyces sp. ADI96-02]